MKGNWTKMSTDETDAPLFGWLQSTIVSTEPEESIRIPTYGGANLRKHYLDVNFDFVMADCQKAAF